MSALLSPFFPFVFWLCVLAAFFYGVYRLAKSDEVLRRSPTPGTDLVWVLATGGSWEVSAILGVIALALGQADKWRKELDDEADNKDDRDEVEK